MAHDSDPASAASLVTLVGGLIHEAKELLAHELELATLEVRQQVGKTKQALRALGSGIGIAVAGGMVLTIMLVHLLEVLTGLPLWGCYGLVGGVLALAGSVLLARGKAQAHAIAVVLPQTAETRKAHGRGLTGQPTAEPRPQHHPAPSAHCARQRRRDRPSLTAKALGELFVSFRRACLTFV
jgi:hypothetical protein